jgi:hypothetical protein
MSGSTMPFWKYRGRGLFCRQCAELPFNEIIKTAALVCRIGCAALAQRESVRVIGPEHLAALAFQAGGGRRRERAWQLIESGSVDKTKLDGLLEKHGIIA